MYTYIYIYIYIHIGDSGPSMLFSFSRDRATILQYAKASPEPACLHQNCFVMDNNDYYCYYYYYYYCHYYYYY